MQITEKTASTDDEGKRFDNVVRKAFKMLTLGRIHKAMRKGDLRLNGQRVKGSEKIMTGDVISFKGFYEEEREEVSLSSCDIKMPALNIIWQNEHLLAINKAAGVLVHDGPESLTEQVRAYLPPSDSLSFKAGPCHRLDRNTSGLIVFAKTVIGARLFAEAMQQDSIKKSYLGLIKGQLKNKTIWKNYLERHQQKTVPAADNQGVYAETEALPVLSNSKVTLVRFMLKTGRTHQIRAQAAIAGFPLVNDIKYGGGGKGHYCLHAHQLWCENSPSLFPLLTAPLSDEFRQELYYFNLDNFNEKAYTEQR